MAELLYKTQTRWLFHAHIKLKFSVFYDDALFDELYAVLEEVDRLYNSYSEHSFIRKINDNAGGFVDVNDETVSILQKVCEWSELFDGEYDMTIMPLVRLWGFYKDEAKKIPVKDEIEAALNKVDFRKIKIAENKVKIEENQEVITGSFIKAYAVDKMVRKMQQAGISDAIINAGGSTIKALTDNGHPHWNVVVKHPEWDRKLFELELSNKCFSTSAQSKTFLEIDGIRYGHIISAKTGYPSANKQIGIISDNCFEGDVISTGLFNLSGIEFKNKMKHLSNTFGVEGFMIDKDDKLYFSDNFEKYISF